MGAAGAVRGVAVSGEVTVEPVLLDNPGWEFARATVTLAVVDSSTGLTVGEVSEVARAGHLTYEEALRKAVREVSQEAARELLMLFEE